jgi:osmotically-inducible protein OsmY
MDLTTRVADAIEKTPELAQRHLHFETERGHVILRGTVGTYFQKQMAQEAVRRVEGVEFIDNELEVAWSEDSLATAI